MNEQDSERVKRLQEEIEANCFAELPVTVSANNFKNAFLQYFWVKVFYTKVCKFWQGINSFYSLMTILTSSKMSWAYSFSLEMT